MSRAAEMAKLVAGLYPDDPVIRGTGKQARANLTPEQLKRRDARAILNRAIKTGQVVPKPCESCGAAGTHASGYRVQHGHHEDYDKPLDVKWLCAGCHHREHRTGRNARTWCYVLANRKAQ